MVNQSADRLIQERVNAFVADLTELVRQSALEAVQEALGGAPVSAPRRGRKKATSKKPAGRQAAAKPATGKRPARRKSGKRIRRTAGDLAAAGEALLAEVKRNPGSGFEALRAALGIDGKDLRRPVNDLLEAKAIRKEGAKRGTKYFPAGGKPGRKPGKKKAGKRKVAKRKTTKRKATRRKATGK